MSTKAADIRNVAFVGHPRAGKTALVDALAFRIGATDRKGSVADKTSLCDTEHEEQEKGHTLLMKTVHGSHAGKTWNLFDSPGYPDFGAEATAAMYASDLVVGVVSCASGVTYNFVRKLKEAAELGRGRAIVITHLDGDNADFDEILSVLRERIGELCVPLHLPDKSGPGFTSVRSVLVDGGEWKKALMDRVMDACEIEEVVMRYLEEETLGTDELHQHMPVAIAKGALVPVLVCRPDKDIGLAELFAFLSEHAPTPETKPAFMAGAEPVFPDPSGELLGVVISIRSDPHVGKVCVSRILRGTLKVSDAIVAATSGSERGEKPGGLFHLIGGKKREVADVGPAGDVIAFSKVEKVKLGDTITSAGHQAPHVAFPTMPPPMVALAVKPKSRADEQKITEAIGKLQAEDPTFHSEHRPLTHELVVTGMSDLHLQVMEARLKRRYGVEVETHVPRIAYQETITKPAEGHHRHKKQTGGRGQFGECYVRLRPGAPGSGVQFVDGVVGGSIPRNLIPAIEKGMRDVATEGILTNNHVVDIEFEVYDGKYHAVDSDEASFKVAGGRALRDAFMKGSPVLLEPVVEVEVSVPTRDAGAVFSDLTSHRRAHVVDQSNSENGTMTVIKARAPLATMQTYFRDLKSQTAGEGAYTMRPSHYERVPAGEQQRILAELRKVSAEE